MYCIVGLGNPGKNYALTRHNIGFITIEKICEDLNIEMKTEKFNALIGDTRIESEKILVVKPLTYMNSSGSAVLAIKNYYKIPIEKIIVIYDDIDIPLGSVRIRGKGSSGTHNGMKSIIRLLGDDSFPRIRVGIGKSDQIAIKDFVIGKISKDEMPALRESVTNAAKASLSIIKEGVDIAMNKYNIKV